MKRLKSILGHTGAILTVMCAIVAPFLLFGWFESAIAAMGLRIHPEFSGGQVARTIVRPGYRIELYQRVGRTSPWQRVDPFIQLRWTPVSALPVAVSEDLDVDGDSKPDVRISFEPARLVADAVPLNPRYHAMHSAGVTSFSKLIARVNDTIVVRVPID